MVERIPVDEPTGAIVGGVLVEPAEHREPFRIGRSGVPEVGRLLLAGGRVHDVPELGGPAEHTEVLVGPVVGRPTHRLGRVPREVLVHRMRRVPGEFGADRPQLFPRPHVAGREFRVGHGRRRSQDHAATGVEGVETADVRSSDDRPDERVDLGFGQRMITGAGHLRSPTGRVVAVEVEALGRGGRRDVEAIEVVDGSLVEDPVAFDVRADARGRDRHEEPGVVGVGDPGSVGIGESHLEDPAITVDVLFVQTRPAMGVGVRPRTNARPPEPRSVGQHPFGTVGVHAWHHVERAGPQRTGDRLVAGAVAVDQASQQPARGDRGGEFDRVDAGVDPVRRLGVVGARRRSRSP